MSMIKIMDILHEKKIDIPENIDEWIDIDNNSFTKLGLKIMVFYNYRKQAKGIIALIHNEDDSVKKAAITAIRKLFLIEAKKDLILLFEKASLEVQLEILQTLLVIGDESLIPFLENIIWTATNKDVKLKAVECLNEIDKTALDALAIKDFDTKKMAKHAREIYL